MLAVVLALLPGLGIGAYIAQWPEKIVLRPGVSLTISCYQNYSSLAYMFWYQQPPKNGLKLIVSSSTWSLNSYEDGYSEAKFEVTRQNTDYSLMTIKNVTAQDAATYFCAANDCTSTGLAQRSGSRGEVFLQLQNGVNNEQLFFGSGTKLTVIGKDDKIIPPAVAIFSPSKQEIQQKSKATLVCLASGFYPDHLTLVWRVNGVKRTEGVGTDESSTQNGSTYSLTSRLRMPAWEWFNPLNRFECVANFFQNGTTASKNKFIHGDAGCALTEESYLRYGNSLKLTYLILCGKALVYAVLVSGLVWTAKTGVKLSRE
ncbi:M1-specific T cell receptor beta chain-like [Agelaius phoeniceus]|uniref:M1-specific T cell receptor beta chain-like n=1 Tax=Agelaius phoeniceus TaxID=39638 RepID=UPI004054FD58